MVVQIKTHVIRQILEITKKGLNITYQKEGWKIAYVVGGRWGWREGGEDLLM